MTFEEEFPSITKMFKEGTELTARTNIPIVALKLYCLDKQRVKEAIKRISDKLHENVEGHWDAPTAGELEEELIRELGL